MKPSMKRQPTLAETGKALGEVITAAMQRQTHHMITAEELHRLMVASDPVTIVDCRAAEDFDDDHIPGAINVPFQRFMDDHSMLPPGGKVLAYCYVGIYSKAAAQRLATSGHEHAMSLEGGWAEWERYKSATA